MLSDLNREVLADVLCENIVSIKTGQKFEELIKKSKKDNSFYYFYLNSSANYKGIINVNKILQKENELEEKTITDENINEFLYKNLPVIKDERNADKIDNLFSNCNKDILVVIEEDYPVGIIKKAEFYQALSDKYNNLKNELSMILNNLHEAVCVVDKEKRVVFWSKKSEELFEIKKEEIMNKKLEKFFPNALLLKVVDEKKAIENIILSPKEGSYVILSGVPIFSNEEFLGAVATDRDVTEIINISRDDKKDKATDKVINFERGDCFDNIIGESEIIKNKINKAARVARTNSSIIISGKTGTGKEIFARTIHCYSKRKGDFVPVNCSAIPESLFESEMFGYVEGAFTGASTKGRLGKFQKANKGTLFLDEIEALPLTMQPKLLRVLQDKEIVPVGGDEKVRVDVRIIAATNENLRKLVEDGKFREDLYYRLNVVDINLPELRERKKDIPLFINYFIEQFCRENNIYTRPKIKPEVLKILLDYDWKGNIRELKNTVEHLVLFSRNGTISKENIPDYILAENNQRKADTFDLKKNLKITEIELIKRALDKTDGNKKMAAELLNIPRSTLYYKLKNYNLHELI